MCQQTTLPPKNVVSLSKRIKAAFQKPKKYKILFSVVLFLTMVAILIEHMLAPQFIPYSDGMIDFSEGSDGVVQMDFNIVMADCEKISYYSQEHQGHVYYISTWNSIWNKIIQKSKGKTTVLNANGEDITSVYYASNDGTKDILIYGNDLFQNGGSITIPQFALVYFVLFAIESIIILGIVLFMIRGRQRIFRIALKIFYLPLTYLLAHLFVKGLHAASYNLTYDLLAILLLTLPFYSLAWFIDWFLRKELS